MGKKVGNDSGTNIVWHGKQKQKKRESPAFYSQRSLVTDGWTLLAGKDSF